MNRIQAEPENQNVAHLEPRLQEPRVPPRVPEPRVPDPQDAPPVSPPPPPREVQPSPPQVHTTAPSAPPLSHSRVPIQSTEPDSTTSLPSFDPQIGKY